MESAAGGQPRAERFAEIQEHVAEHIAAVAGPLHLMDSTYGYSRYATLTITGIPIKIELRGQDNADHVRKSQVGLGHVKSP